ncbi:MAG: zinc ribbon domain-containing protein [Actinomycetota bacterium]
METEQQPTEKSLERCANCGEVLPPSSNFCRECGAALAPEPRPKALESSAVDYPRPMATGDVLVAPVEAGRRASRAGWVAAVVALVCLGIALGAALTLNGRLHTAREELAASREQVAALKEQRDGLTAASAGLEASNTELSDAADVCEQAASETRSAVQTLVRTAGRGSNTSPFLKEWRQASATFAKCVASTGN